MLNIKEQTSAQKNQIQNEKPNIFKNANILQGYFSNSCNGGFIKPIAYAPVMAGTKHLEYRIKACIRMQTPKTPVFQKLKANFKAFFVPNKRVWENAEKFLSQKGGATEIKIKTIPNLGNTQLSYVAQEQSVEDAITIPFTDTDIWRDSFLSTYIPRYQSGAIAFNNQFRTFPKYSILPLRGFIAIYNDFLRNKEYDEPLQEDVGDNTSSTTFLGAILASPNYTTKYIKTVLRGRRQNSYYTDYRTELLGQDGTEPTLTGTNDLVDLTEWEKTISELRSQAENAQLNDWDIIAKIRGSKPLTEGKVQLLGEKTVGLNYQAVEQTINNLNDTIEESAQVLGEQGAFSYTEIDIPLYQMQEFNEEGYIHVIMQVSADTVFETAFDRIGLNVKWDDIYRPDLKDVKEDVLFEIEKCGTRINSADELEKVTGFKRKFNEYFKLPDCISGDMCTRGYYKTSISGRSENGISLDLNDNNEPIISESKKSFQFFESDDKETANFMPKNIWQDYTDIAINENQAIRQEVERFDDNDMRTYLRIKGDNQIFFIGLSTIIADLPIDENIRKNFTKWGEK